MALANLNQYLPDIFYSTTLSVCTQRVNARENAVTESKAEKLTLA